MLRFAPTAEEAMSDAADAHLIVFAFRNTRSVPAWLMNWLGRWAVLRQSLANFIYVLDAERSLYQVQDRLVQSGRTVSTNSSHYTKLWVEVGKWNPNWQACKGMGKNAKPHPRL